jgi:hypothetical protein
MWRIVFFVWIVRAFSGGDYLPAARAQNYGVHLKAYVSTDSVRIGERLFYSVVVHRPDSLQLFFPPALERAFKPLTLLEVHVSPSVRISGRQVKDSVAYELTLLDRIDSVQLQLPVYAWVAPDTLRFLTPARVLYLNTWLPPRAQADTLELRVEVALPSLVDRPLYLWWGLGAVAALLLLWRLLVPLWRYLMKLWLLYQWDKRWQDYEEQVFERGQEAIWRADGTAMEQLRRQWLDFMELLQGQPLKSLTSAELAALWQDETLKQALACIDKAIYGGHFEQELPEAWMTLHRLAAREYELLIDKLKKDKDAVKAIRFALHR